MARPERHDHIEIIELLTPNAPTAVAVTPAAVRPTDALPLRRRLPRPVAALLIAAILATVAVVVTATDPDAAHRAAPTRPATTESPSTTSAAAPEITPVPGAGSSAHLVADRPAGFVPDSAADQSGTSGGSGLDDPAQPPDNAVSSLWATGMDASPGTSWFILRVDPGGTVPADATGQQRVSTTFGTALVRDAGNGRLVVDAPVSGGSVDLVTAGMDVTAAVALISAAHINGSDVSYDPHAVPSAFYLVATSDRDGDSRVSAPPLDSVVMVAVPLGTGSATYDIVTTRALTTFQHVLEWFFLLDTTNVEVDGDLGMIGTSVRGGSPVRTLVVDHAGLHISVAGDVDDAVLTAAAGSLRPATALEWQHLVDRGQAGAQMSGVPQTTVATGSGVLADGTRWTSSAQRFEGSPYLTGFLVSTPDAGSTIALEITGNVGKVRGIVTATARYTAVVGVAPPGTSGAMLHIVTQDGAVRDVGLRVPTGDHDGSVPSESVAVAVLGDVGAVTAQIIAADGALLTTIDAPQLP